VPLSSSRIWLRAACDFLSEEAQFSYSTDGKSFHAVGVPFRMVFQLMTFQGVRYALFSLNVRGPGGFADFDRIDVDEPNPRGLTRAIPYGRDIAVVTDGPFQKRWLSVSSNRLHAADAPGTRFTVVDRGLGRVALRCADGFISVAGDGGLVLTRGSPGPPETFQWIETFTGELILLSLSTHRYVRLDPETGVLRADSRGPHPNSRDGVRWDWTAHDR
jgi:hypothetical protein